MKKSSESVGAGGGLGSPPRRLTLAAPLVWCWRASLPPGVVGSTSFQLNTTREVWACRQSVAVSIIDSVNFPTEYCDTSIQARWCNHTMYTVATYHNVSVSVITSGPVPGELQDSVSTCFLPTDQEPVLAWINGRQGLSICIAVLQG